MSAKILIDGRAGLLAAALRRNLKPRSVFPYDLLETNPDTTFIGVSNRQGLSLAGLDFPVMSQAPHNVDAA